MEVDKALQRYREEALWAEAYLDSMEERPETVPPSEMEVEGEAAEEGMPAPVWPQTNYQDFVPRTAPLFRDIAGKPELATLAYESAPPPIARSRAFELYSTKELRAAHPQDARVWQNRFKDPCKPAKCWPWSVFSVFHQKQDFRFLVARVTQIGPQYQDPKLPMLRSQLSKRWGVPVMFERMDPCLDWMVCIILMLEGNAKEILSTALIRLFDGNASYIMRHFAPVTRFWELELEIHRDLSDPTQVYDWLRKWQLE